MNINGNISCLEKSVNIKAFPNVDEWWRDQERRLEHWPADPSMELVSDLCSNVTETIYQACQRSSRGPQPEVQGNIEAINAHSRWGSRKTREGSCVMTIRSGKSMSTMWWLIRVRAASSEGVGIKHVKLELYL